jgi:ABC-type antimicrobial peptide transport system permease subunit
MVMRDGLALVIMGLAVGLFAAYLLCGLAKSLLYGIQPSDAITFAIATCILIAVGTTAIYGPARRATRVEPLVALRHE